MTADFAVLWQFLKYCVVGGIGLGLQSAVFWVLTRRFGVKDFTAFRLPVVGKSIQLPYALSMAVVLAVAFNFAANKLWTFA